MKIILWFTYILTLIPSLSITQSEAAEWSKEFHSRVLESSPSEDNGDEDESLTAENCPEFEEFKSVVFKAKTISELQFITAKKIATAVLRSSRYEGCLRRIDSSNEFSEEEKQILITKISSEWNRLYLVAFVQTKVKAADAIQFNRLALLSIAAAFNPARSMKSSYKLFKYLSQSVSILGHLLIWSREIVSDQKKTIPESYPKPPWMILKSILEPIKSSLLESEVQVLKKELVGDVVGVASGLTTMSVLKNTAQLSKLGATESFGVSLAVGILIDQLVDAISDSEMQKKLLKDVLETLSKEAVVQSNKFESVRLFFEAFSKYETLNSLEILNVAEGMARTSLGETLPDVKLSPEIYSRYNLDSSTMDYFLSVILAQSANATQVTETQFLKDRPDLVEAMSLGVGFSVSSWGAGLMKNTNFQTGGLLNHARRLEVEIRRSVEHAVLNQHLNGGQRMSWQSTGNPGAPAVAVMVKTPMAYGKIFLGGLFSLGKNSSDREQQWISDMIVERSYQYLRMHSLVNALKHQKGLGG
jgi:hypothetical protein